MDVRIKNLSNLDPLTVPLPNGTEVSTRVDRVLADRLVPQGAVGRVVRIDGEWVDVQVVGVGVVRYQRSELLPRKVGQVRYAQRRDDAWEALRPCVILETVVGSTAWGLSDENSDLDLRGVFALPLSWTMGLVDAPSDLISTDGSATYWEVGKAVRQALRADPNTLETLFLPGARAIDPIGEWLIQEREAFVSSEIYGSFGRYALSQLKRMEHSLRLAEHRNTVLEWLRETPAPGLDEVARRLASLSPRPSANQSDAEHQAKQYIKQLYRSMHDQGLIASNDFASLVVFARDRAADFDLPRDLRPKNAYNLIRLLGTATRWLRTGAPVFQAEGEFRDRLLAIKRGEVLLEEVVVEAERMAPDLEVARRETRLPTHPDVGAVDRLLRRCGEECARRWVGRVPGPFGADAPPTPEVRWDDE